MTQTPPSQTATQTVDSRTPGYRPWLQIFAILLVISTFILIGIGGHVTSTGSGLAVPDWPTTFGHEMITAPPSVWWDNLGMRYEHTHRLKGTLVGLLTIVLALSLTFTQWRRPWLIVLGYLLLISVIIQGLLGGFRVTEQSDTLAFLHGVFGQIIFAGTVIVAIATGKTWLRMAPHALRWSKRSSTVKWMQRFSIVVLAMLVFQLMLGAAVRHTGGGRSIPDFPLHYGQVMPPMSQESLKETITEWDNAHPDEPVWKPYNRVDEQLVKGEIEPDQAYDTLWATMTKQVHFHFTHRTFAYIVTGAVLIWVAWALFGLPGRPELLAPTLWLTIMIVFQVLLGAAIVWTKRDPNITTGHQAIGALILATATWLAVRLFLVSSQPNTMGNPSTLAKPNPAETQDSDESKDASDNDTDQAEPSEKSVQGALV